MTFTLQTGKNGDPNKPVPWPTFPQFLTAQPGFIASPTWLAAVDGNADLATQPVGTGPFMVAEFINGDRMTVVKNPNYWRKDANGSQLPYLDAIEFRVIEDAQVRDQALQAGDIDLHATSDGNVVSNVRRLHRPGDAAAGHVRRDELHDVPPHQAAARRTRACAARCPGHRPPGPRRRHRRRLPEGRQRPVLAGPGGLPRRHRPARRTTRRGRQDDRRLGGRQRPADAQLLDDAHRHDEGDRRLPAGGVDGGRRRRHADAGRAVQADHQRPARLARLRGLRLAQPRRHRRRHPEPLVARLRRRRHRHRGRRRRAEPQLRPAQRPGDQRPPRPGPLGDRPGQGEGPRPADQPGVRQAVLDHADCTGRRGASS